MSTSDPAKPLSPGRSPAVTTKEAFTEVYDKALWGKNARGLGYSGAGSLVNATFLYRAFLQTFLKTHAIRSVVDAGCGDWTFSQTLDWTGIDYKGFDIVESVIARNKETHTKPNIQFFAGNFVDLDLPPADLLLCKHALQHLPTADVKRFLPQLAKYKHILLSNSVNEKTLSAPNRDISAGDFRNLDPTAPPFNLAGMKVLTYWDRYAMQQVVYIANKI